MAHTCISRVPTHSYAGGVRGSHGSFQEIQLPVLLIKLGLSCSETWERSKASRLQETHSSLRLACKSAISDSPGLQLDEDIGLAGGLDLNESELGPPPTLRHQPSIPLKDRKAWRSKAETMAKEKRLLNIQIGHLGITPSFLRACADILQKHFLVRVKLGEGCGLERRSAAAVLEKYLDCVCVHEVGFTVTLYRQAGLPRPSNTLRSTDEAGAIMAAAALQAEAQARSAAIVEKQKRKKAGQQRPQQRPAEFSVL